MRLGDRVAFACRYLTDEQLEVYIEEQVKVRIGVQSDSHTQLQDKGRKRREVTEVTEVTEVSEAATEGTQHRRREERQER